jgi:magnesium transporter
MVHNESWAENVNRTPPPNRVRVVLSSRMLVSYVSAWRAAARALAELGVPVFFIAGTAWLSLGAAAPWCVLAAVAAGLVLRAADLEARSLFVPGGLYGTVRATLGRVPATVATSALLIDRLMLGALASLVGAQYVVALVRAVVGTFPIGPGADNGALFLALGAIAAVWILQRRGRGGREWARAATLGLSVATLGVLLAWAGVSAIAAGGWRGLTLPWRDLLGPTATGGLLGWLPPRAGFVGALLAALGFALPALGGVDALAVAGLGVEEPRIPNLRRAARMVALFSLVLTAGSVFLFVALVPGAERETWAATPLAGLVMKAAAPTWLRLGLLAVATLAAAGFLWVALRAASVRTYGLLARLADEGVIGHHWRAPHHRFGTPWRVIDATGMALVGIVLLSGGQVQWLAAAWACAVTTSAVLQAAALVRFRATRPGRRAYTVPGNVRMAGRDWPIVLMATAALLAASMAALLASLDGDTLGGAALVIAVALALGLSERRLARRAAGGGGGLDQFQLLSSPDVDLREVDVRPGGFLVPVRKPRGLVHLADALRSAGNRDVVAMTVRLVGVDVPEDAPPDLRASEEERELLSAVIAVAEAQDRAVRLLIVRGTSVVDSVIETALRLESSEIHVGESETVSADEQARVLGEAWDRAPRPSSRDLRLVVHHPRGGTQAYQLGAHAPALLPEDFDQIHRLWLDIARQVGPHVHHRDVVRAALKHMEQDLNGAHRDEVLQVVRETARPADAVAAFIRERDFGRLRDVLRNRPASDIGSVLAGLPIEEQVLVFRILPRKEAAATFAYLSADEQNGLLRAMASEEAAVLLNDMAPDDRTTFLEELPADATRQLLNMLKPEERAVAVRLLGYPENSIGRLMTPHYVRVREGWTVEQVLQHVRAHGHNSETLNVLYVVDDGGKLVDDIHIREVLLSPPSTLVHDLMDRRFVALKAADDQETAVRVFRAEDRTALPVTDSAGILIGIVTVDDVLDVAEQEATEDLQRFGGSEALDEPYMDIGFGRMIQKRAGWLTALFLGEMLTATAMGAFEREIERAVVLALFVPLIISSGGNSGSQASTLVIRALALGEVTLKDWWRVMRREFAAGLTLGGILGTIGFFRITVWSAFSNIYGPHWFLVAVTVALALVGIVLWGTLVGSLLPFGLRRAGFDPAASSAPFVATLVDVTGLVIYFSVGIVVLRGTLL